MTYVAIAIHTIQTSADKLETFTQVLELQGDECIKDVFHWGEATWGVNKISLVRTESLKKPKQ